MSKIKTITPVHIGSGQKIYTLKKDTYLYSIDKIIEEKVNNSSDSNLQKLLASCSYLANKTNPTKIDLYKALSINDYSIPLSTRISNDPAYAKAIESETADLFLAQKSLDKLIIPGSAIKGMLNNLFWYHVIDSNDYIKKYFKENINRISKILNELDGTIKNMKSFLRITDIIFDSNPRVFTVKRYSSKNDCMPVGNHETISYDESTNCDFIRSLSETDVKMMDEVKKEIREIYKSEWAGKDGLMVHKIDDVYWIYYCNRNSKKDADISICLEGSKLVMNCYDNAKSLFDIEPFCWKLFAVKSPVTIEQVEIITGDDRQTVNV